MNNILKEFNLLIKNININDKKTVIKTFNNMCKLVEEKKYNIEINNINNHIEKILIIIKNNNCNLCNICKNCKLINNNLDFINFIEYKNKLLINDAINLPCFNDFINNIIENYNKKYNKIIKGNNVKLALNKLLMENINKFYGNWDIIICNNSCLVKSIELIDPIKLNNIFNYINEQNIKK